MYHPKCELTVLIQHKHRDKTFIGRTPFEVCVFKSEEQWDYLTSDPSLNRELTKKTLIARFAGYGDAYSYANRVKESAMYWRVLLRS